MIETLAWPTHLTKHQSFDAYKSSRRGAFGFGTTSYFRRNFDGSGLMSDHYEGINTRRLINRGSTSVVDKLILPNGYIQDVAFEGVSLHTELAMNDYAACFSPGKFDKSRADNIRAHNNGRLTHYVTYDTALLVEALWDALLDRKMVKRKSDINKVLIGGKVVYDDRDNNFSMPTIINADWSRVDEASWFRTTFVKPERFEHEDEFRIVLLLKKPGTLFKKAGYLKFASRKFQQAIVCHGPIALDMHQEN